MTLQGDELVRRARLGDGAAMAALYTRHVQSVHAYLVLQETRNAVRLVGDAFGAAFSSMRTLAGGDREFRIHVLGHAHELLILEATSDQVGGVAPIVLSPVIRRYLRALVPAQRDVIALQVASGLAVSEAALVLRLSEPMVDIAQSRALRRLQHAGSGAPSAASLPPSLAVAVLREGGRGAVTSLAAAVEAIPPVVPAENLRVRFASNPTAPAGAAPRRRSRVKLAAAVGTGVGKVVLGAGIAAAAAGGAHVSGVVDLPLLPPVTRVSSTQEVNDNPPAIAPSVDDEAPTEDTPVDSGTPPVSTPPMPPTVSTTTPPRGDQLDIDPPPSSSVPVEILDDDDGERRAGDDVGELPPPPLPPGPESEDQPVEERDTGADRAEDATDDVGNGDDTRDDDTRDDDARDDDTRDGGTPDDDREDDDDQEPVEDDRTVPDQPGDGDGDGDGDDGMGEDRDDDDRDPDDVDEDDRDDLDGADRDRDDRGGHDPVSEDDAAADQEVDIEGDEDEARDLAGDRAVGALVADPEPEMSADQAR